jgi:hypothetical protein
VVSILLLAGLGAPVTGAAENFYGLLRARDLTPFGFLRLDMRPAHAMSIRPGSWAVETEFDYQNTWAMSPEVERYLTGLEASGRRVLGEEELAAIRALPGENYLVDIEMATVDMTLHYKFSPRVSGYLILSGVNYGGGFLDGTVERFHDSFGFQSAGRPAVARNDVNLIYDLKSVESARLGNPPSDGGWLDPTLGVRYSAAISDAWQVSVEGAVKLALAGRREFLSTGHSDLGVQAAAQYRRARHAWYANAAAVWFAGGEIPVQQDRQVVPTLVLGYEYAWTARTHLNLQAYASRSVFSREQTDLPELLDEKYQVTVGVRHRLEQMVVTFGITENVQNINNTPDIGFQLGVAWLPGGSRR